MSSNWFPTKVYCFHECLITQLLLFAVDISVCTDSEHQGNRYPTARNSASPPETFTQQLDTPGTVTILQGVNGCLGKLEQRYSKIGRILTCKVPANEKMCRICNIPSHWAMPRLRDLIQYPLRRNRPKMCCYKWGRSVSWTIVWDSFVRFTHTMGID